MIVSIGRQQPATDSAIGATRLVQNGKIERRMIRDRMSTIDRPLSTSVVVASGSTLPAQVTASSFKTPARAHTRTNSAGASSSVYSSDQTLRDSASTAISTVSSAASCAPTPTLSPNGSPKLTRKNSYHSLRRPRASSYLVGIGDPCVQCLEDATVRSTIGYSDDEDDDSLLSTVKPARTATADSGSNHTQQSEEPATAAAKAVTVRRTQSLTMGARRKVVSMHVPSNFMLTPSVWQHYDEPAAQTDANRTEPETNGSHRKSEEFRIGVDGSQVQKQQTTQRKAVAPVSNVLPVKGQKVLATTVSASPPCSNEDIPNFVALQQQSADKQLLPDKNLFMRKSQVNAESILNPASAPAQPQAAVPIASSAVSKGLNAGSKRIGKFNGCNLTDDAELVGDEGHYGAGNGAASGPLPVKASHAQQPLKFDWPEPRGRASSGNGNPVAARNGWNKAQGWQQVQCQMSEDSTLRAEDSCAEDTDIDANWDELSGVASYSHSQQTTNSKVLNVSRATQSTQHEMNGVLESYEMYLNELDVITKKERQQFELVRRKMITVECWRDTAKNILKFKVAAVEQMQKLLETA